MEDYREEVVADDGEIGRNDNYMPMELDVQEKSGLIAGDVESTPAMVVKAEALLTAEEYMERFYSKNYSDEIQVPSKRDTVVHELNMKTPKVSGAALIKDSGTQARVDAEIDLHYEEEKYINGFEKKLKELHVVFNNCLTDFEVTGALYPQNAKLGNLVNEFGKYFKMFRECSPISKSLAVDNARGIRRPVVVDDEAQYIPNYSLDLTQMTPKNLGTEMEVIAEDQEKLFVCVAKGKKGLGQMKSYNEDRVSEQHVNLRPRRGLIPAQVCRSQFKSKVVDVSAHQITTEERNTWNWLFENKRNKKDFLFKWNDKKCTKGHFQSLHDNKLVETTVFDTWSYLLNVNEILNCDSSPMRLFLTTETTYDPFQLEAAGRQEIEYFSSFNDHVELALMMVNEVNNKQYDVKDFDMFVFPMFHGAHHYIISYNIKKPSMEIIDNRVQTLGFDETYGCVPELLHKCFCQFLKCYKLSNFGDILKLKPVVVSMEWQTVDNNRDCGIFAMRHMETYMGDVSMWTSGLRTENDNQQTLLSKLRVIYAHDMLTWTRNEKRPAVMEGIAKSLRSKKAVA